MEFILNRFGTARRVTWNGKEYLVAPMTSIVPGVLPGSQGPLYYPLSEIKRSVGRWDGMPITNYHPMSTMGENVSAQSPGILTKQGIGIVRKSTCNGKLQHEGWFDVESTKRKAPAIYNALINNQPLEISTGLFTDNEEAQPGATYNGRPFAYTARNYRPDHIAVLPDQVGACSINDGCGLMVNSNPEGINQYTTGGIHEKVLEYVKKHGEVHGGTVGGASSSGKYMGDMRNDLGHKKFDSFKPLKNPVHQAAVDLIKSGHLEHVPAKGWGQGSVKATGKELTANSKGNKMPTTLPKQPITNKCKCGEMVENGKYCSNCGQKMTANIYNVLVGLGYDPDTAMAITINTPPPAVPRHQNTGQFLNKGLEPGMKQMQTAAEKGYGDTDIPFESNDPESDQVIEDDADDGQDRVELEKENVVPYPTANAFESDEQRIGFFASGPSAGGGKVSGEAHAATKEANRKGSAASHKQAASAHREASEHHTDEGNTELAKGHAAAARHHAAKARNLTRNQESSVATRAQLIEQLAVNCSCTKDRAALNQLSDAALVSLTRAKPKQKPVTNEEDFNFGKDITTNAFPPPKGDKGKGKVPPQFAKKDEEPDGDEEDDPEMNAGNDDHSFDTAGKKSSGSVQAGGEGTKDEYPTGNRRKSFTQLLEQHGSPQEKAVWNHAVQVEKSTRINLVKRLISNIQDPQRKQLVGNRLLKTKTFSELQEMVELLPPTQNQYGEQQDAPYNFMNDTQPTENQRGEPDILEIPTINYNDDKEQAEAQ